MAIRNTHGKTRFESPRTKDIPQLTEGTAREPTEGRTVGGRFAPGNRAAIGRAAKTITLASLGNPDDPHTGELAKLARTLYFALLRDLPSDGPAVRQTVAAQARNATLAAEYSRLAANAGLGTAGGMKLADAARAHDTTANRLAVTALDMATRAANSKPKELPSWLRPITVDAEPVLALPAAPEPTEPEGQP